MTWYTIVKFGAGSAPARGPFRTIEDATAAVERFRIRRGGLAGSDLAAGSVRILGPYRTRREARAADFNDGVRSWPLK